IQLSSQAAFNHKVLTSELNAWNADIAVILKTDEGIVLDKLKDNQADEVKSIVKEIKGVSESFYIGLDLNDYGFEMNIAPKLSDYGSLFIVNKVRYYHREDVKTSMILSKILREESGDVGLFQNDEVYYDLKDTSLLDQIYSQYSRAIRNTLEFIDSVSINIDLSGHHLPKYPLEGISASDKLLELANKGLVRRLKQSNRYQEMYDIYQSRLKYEIDIIKKMKYEDYFLIVWDFVLYAKKHDIMVGPGRGSAAGSLVAYVLGIVDVDPIEHELYFERFLNPERISMPDIDMDFPDDKREEVIRYVIDKYGKEKVVSIITYGTFQGKSAVRDAGRIMEIDNVVIDELSKQLSKADNSIEVFRKKYSKEYSYYQNIPEIKELMEVAEKLNGLVKHVSTHAAGIIIAGEDIREHSPIQPGLMDAYQTQYEAQDLEELGLLKFDFLGLRNLTIINDTLALIKANEHIDINIYKIPLDDQPTYDLLKKVKTLGVFQLESRGMMDLVAKMQIGEFSDIATCISMFRPGPMENIPTYLKIRNNEERISYPHIDLLPILKPTNGIIIYQEQIMTIANKFAGYTLAEADVLRKAVSKKNRSILESERRKFVAGSKKQGYSEIVADEIYDYIVKFANYGFNKSHAVAYAMVAYWMAYLKANYGSYFLSVLLDSMIGSVNGTKTYIMEAKQMGIDVLPPRINMSDVNYKTEDDNLRFPIKGIKGIGPIAAMQVVNVSKESPVTDLVDFVKRRGDIHVNVIEALIYAGVFDDFGLNKRTMVENLSKLISYADLNYQNEQFNFIPFDEYDYEWLHGKEKELLGLNFKYHILYKYRHTIKKENYRYVSDIIDSKDTRVQFVGAISRIKEIMTKNNQEMAFVEVEDVYNSVDTTIFPRTYEGLKPIINIGSCYLFFGKKEMRNGKVQIIVDNIKELKE
ncbi:MAG TPA: DNA polymerase III subunit alpha, partial [Bacillota bacterium]|nr:DNA polymerase III subunit alpha [Bacillota bacterium]